MDLTVEQKKAVEGWVKEGSTLSQIQKRLSSEFGISMTYMEVRFLVIDLGLKVKDKAAASSASARPMGQPDALAGKDRAAAQKPGGVAVEVDRITKPGSIVSGTVTFSDGVKASWLIDELGRLGLKAAKQGYAPSQQDIALFQEEIRKALEKHGF